MSRRAEHQITPTLADNWSLIERLQRTFEAELARVATGVDKYVLLDFPNHANIGDSAIYVGETIALRKVCGRAPGLVTEASEHELDAVGGRRAEEPIFLHG